MKILESEETVLILFSTFCSDVKRIEDAECAPYWRAWSNAGWNFCAETDRLDHTTATGDSGDVSMYYLKNEHKLLKMYVLFKMQ